MSDHSSAPVNSRPDVSVNQTSTDNEHRVDVVITRDEKGRSYVGIGSSGSEAVREVVRKIINDPVTREWLP